MDGARAEASLRLLAEAELPTETALLRVSQPDQAAAWLLRQPAAAAATLLSALPELERTVVTLQYQAGLSEAETAAAMRISVEAVRFHTHHGRSLLRRGLSGYDRMHKLALMLTAVGALDEDVAAQVLADFQFAVAVRSSGAGGLRGWHRVGLTVPLRPKLAQQGQPPGPAGPPTAPIRIVPIGRTIAFRDEDVCAELYVLSYARAASGPQLSVLARTRDQAGVWQPSGPRLFDPFSATDDRGTSYQADILPMGSGPTGWVLMLRPDPPHEPRWLDLMTTAGGPAVRIDLDTAAGYGRTLDADDVTIGKAALNPGEYQLHTIAARLIAAASSGPDKVAGPVMPVLGKLIVLVDGLGGIIAALQACGALSALSPLPGQLAGLCAALDVDGHGITAPPADDLPEPWSSSVACLRQRKAGASPARDGYAAVTAMLPELDGIRLTILGLHNCQDRTVMHTHIRGPQAEGLSLPDGLYSWATLWVHDSGGCWHATRCRGGCPGPNEMTLLFEVAPPLSRGTAWIELLATGQSAEFRVKLPLQWQRY